MRAQSARMKSPRPIRIELGPSRLAGAFIAVAHLATAALVAWLPVDASLRALAVMAIGTDALWAIRSVSLRSLKSSIVAAELAADRRVALIQRDGGRIEGQALPESYVGERLATLTVRRDGSRRTSALWLLPDMVAKQDLRQFRVLLRLGRTPDVT
jgi:hypothetical protein